MQSEECRNTAGVSAANAQRYGFFQLAGVVGAPRWRNSMSLAFPPSDVAALEGCSVTPGCIGLLGMAGALPYHYSEAIARNSGTAAHDFMDLLSARAIDLFCAAWREGRPEHVPLPALPMLRGPLRGRALGERLAQALGVPLRIEQFSGHWEQLLPAQLSALGSGNALCGLGALLGERLWRRDQAVKIHVGPLGSLAARAFLPGASAALVLAELWRSAASGSGLQAEAHIHLQAGACAGLELGSGARLGHDALLMMETGGERDDLRYRLC